MKIAVIPARGGSRRIPNKNIRNFCGKPIIAYSIGAAKQTGIFDKIIVSTDSEKIADVSRQYGAEIPFMRPPELADDFSGTDGVVLHALEWMSHQTAFQAKYVCCIYATAPFVRAEFLLKGLEMLIEEKASAVFSVTTFPYPILRALKVAKTGRMEMFWPEYRLSRSQDLPEAYHDAGQFYWADAKRFLEEKSFLSKKTLPFILPRYLVQDIDTPEDWERAELMFKTLGCPR
jgi:pseudaminic acid cytidylyltransferase